MIPFITIFIVLSIAGMCDAGYLFWKRNRAQPLVCPIGESCDSVTKSGYSTTFKIHNDILGFLYYFVLFCGAAKIMFFPELYLQLRVFLEIMTVTGVIFSAYLTYVQAVILKNYCFYCLISATLSILLCITSFAI